MLGLTPGLARREAPAPESAPPTLAADPGCFGANAVEGLFNPNDAPPELAVFVVAAAAFCGIYPLAGVPSFEPA